MSNPAASFEPYRRRLLGLAYRMLGSMADAEDAVQETYLRRHAADHDNVSAPRAFLMTTTTEHVVPGHTRPVLGVTNARDALTTYRDAIRSVYDQTIEGMKKGERPDELVAHVKLPPHLAGSPYLQEYYGTVEWSVRAIYSDHLGWFDGNATHLFPMPEAQRAQRIVALAGGVPRTLSRGREAHASGDFRWAAELADVVLAVDAANVEAKRLKAQALTELGERQTSANARNYYLSVAQNLLRGLPR